LWIYFHFSDKSSDSLPLGANTWFSSDGLNGL
jgi:hypothetical protein